MSAELTVGIAQWLRRIGGTVTGAASKLGFVSRFLLAVLWHTPGAFRRMHLTLREIYFAGVLSLVIILMSGLFVGMVLSLQGYETLKRYGAGEQLGILVALSLVRELGPVMAGLLAGFAVRNLLPIDTALHSLALAACIIGLGSSSTMAWFGRGGDASYGMYVFAWPVQQFVLLRGWPCQRGPAIASSAARSSA